MPLRHAIRTALIGGVLAVLGLPGAPGYAPPALAAQSLEYDGAAATGLALRQLGTTARVLHIGAHPDDENTALFAPLALGRGIDAAYLSLTRGEGGQNGIGPELGTALGIIRSEELLSARRLDGGEQLFTRAIDYGYSKNAEEAFRHWPRDSLLADVVAAIRSYRPDIVISVWTGTPRDGHGQHHASGIIAREAFLAAGDPERFPDQIERGLRPHAPSSFFWSARYGEDGPDVLLSTGELDPLLGQSYHQIAMASRSRHRSQDMGVPQAPGPRSTAFDRVDPTDPPPVAERGGFGRVPEGMAVGDESLFTGVDTLLSQRAARVAAAEEAPAGSSWAELVDLLRRYEERVAGARDAFNPLRPERTVPDLVRAHHLLASAIESLGSALSDSDAGGWRDLHFHLRDELQELHRAVLHAANIEVDVIADEELLVPGQRFQLQVAVWNGGTDTIHAEMGPLLPQGWSAAPADEAAAGGVLIVPPGERVAVPFTVTVPGDAEPTTPYYLDPRAATAPEDFYEWPPDPEVWGLTFQPDPVQGSFMLRVADVLIPRERAARWVGLDRRSGEFRRPVRVVPAVSLQLSPAVAVLPRAGERRTVEATARLRSQLPGGTSGALDLDLPSGWSVTPERPAVEFSGEGEEQALELTLTAPADVAAGEYEIRGTLVTPDGSYSIGYDVVDYPHIDPHHLYRAALLRVEVFDVRVADVAVGYVRGAGDGVPEALDQLGVRWEAIDAATLASGDLDRFDVIITGIRAYEVRPDLVTHNQRLLDWARRGGTLLVQYNKYEFPAGDFAPWPVTMSRPHGRVTDPAAPVTILEPEHPALTTPNRLDQSDWEGWVQERGLYFLESWEGPFTPLLAMSDPGEDPLTGSLLVAPLGDGRYVYTGLAFFRQLPVGVPGAYRLLANLISLGAEAEGHAP